MIFIPGLQKIYEGHTAVIQRYGGSDGVIAQREPLLRAAFDAVENYIQYRDEQRVGVLAGLLCIRIVNAHAFIDGNKRAGTFALMIMLEANGFEILPANQMHLYRLLIQAITKELTEEQFCEAIQEISRKII